MHWNTLLPARMVAQSCAMLFLTPALMQAQMVSPSIDDPQQPFSYFSKPTGELGLPFAEAATEVTPEGYLRTGFGELMFFGGPEWQPLSMRIRTLRNGYLPIQHEQTTIDGIRYEIDMTAADVTANGKSHQTDFIRVTVTNTTSDTHGAFFATGIRYDGPKNVSARHADNRFDRPVTAHHVGDYRQLGETFNPEWNYVFAADRFVRDGRVLYLFPAGADRSFALHTFYNYPEQPETATKLNIAQDTPAGIARYRLQLKPGESHVLEFRMPVVPTADTDELNAINAMTFAEAAAQDEKVWMALLQQGMHLSLPESKPVDTFNASLIYDLMAIDHLGDDYIQTVNKLHYHAFYLRDTADIVRMYELTGYSDIAAKVLAFYAHDQQNDGNFLSQDQQYDGWGEALYAYGIHYRMTHDRVFAASVLPRIDRAVDWLITARAKDPLHIMPGSDVRDNEYVPGHLTGYNFLALAGLKDSIAMARDCGRKDLADKWQKEETSYRAAFLDALNHATAQTGGYIPPALDNINGGYDWGNLLAVVPEPVLDPMDPRVAKTLAVTQAKYQEGIMTYANGSFLHHYLTIKNTLTELERGEQQQPLAEFYGLLLHTGSDHGGFEFAIHPWGDRNFADNLAPHGWFAAEYRTLLRNMLVREQSNDLHLLSVVSPGWIGSAKTIAATNVPTAFGTVSLRLEQPSESVAILHLDAAYREQPGKIIVHLPWFMSVQSAIADGKPVHANSGLITLPAPTKTLELHWAPNGTKPVLSYEQTVRDYKAEYLRRYEKYVHGDLLP